MVKERTKNATRNMIFGILQRMYHMLVPFFMRTAMIYFMGVQYVGLNSLFTSILQVLNLAELGVGSAMVYSMYKPIAEDDKDTICALMRLYKIYYRVIGSAIAVVGLGVTPFIPCLVSGSIPENLDLHILYLLNLAATVFSYWLFAYKNSLLMAHQRTDVTKIQQISGLEQRLDEINEIPKNQRRLKSVEEHMKMLEQEEQKYQTLRRQLYEDMSNGIVSKDEYKEFSRSFNEKVENICKAKTEMNRQLDSLSNLDVEHLPWIEDFKSYQNLTSLNRRVLVELVESITVYDKEHIHIQYRFDQEIRNVLEYCNSVLTTETEEGAV